MSQKHTTNPKLEVYNIKLILGLHRNSTCGKQIHRNEINHLDFFTLKDCWRSTRSFELVEDTQKEDYFFLHSQNDIVHITSKQSVY